MVHSSRGKAKGRSRILYWFRTPPGVKVGRSALDDESVRQIQATHPDIDFDWPQLLKGRPEPAAERPRQEPPSRPARPGDKQERRGRPEGSRRPERRQGSPESPDSKPAVAAPQPRVPVAETPAADTGPAAARLGAAGLQRLRARYTEIVARIQTRVEEEARRAELTAIAVRLNPDEWASDEAVAAGLEGYEATYEEVKNAIGSRRKPPVPAEPAAPGEDGEGDDTGAVGPPRPDDEGPL